MSYSIVLAWFATHNILYSSVCSNAENNDTNDENNGVDNGLENVLPLVPVTLLEQLEPKGGREVKGEARDEEAGRDGEQVREEGDGLGNDPGDQRDNSNKGQPGDPAHLGVDVLDDRVLKDAAVDVAGHDGGVDGARDEDNGQRNAKGDLGDGASRGQERRRLHVLADEHVDEGARHGVNDNLDGAEGHDGLGKVFRGMHLVHEGELAQGETVGENDVAEGHKGLGELETLLGPQLPRGARSRNGGRRGVGVLNAGGDDGDSDGNDNRGEIHVTQNSHLGKGRRDGQEHEDDGRDEAENDGAGAVVGNVVEGNSAGQAVGTDGEDELERKHGADELVAKLAHEQPPGVGIVRDVGVAQLDLADNVRRVDGDEAETDGEDDAGDHAERGKRRGDTQRAQGNGLDQEHHGQALPAQAVKVRVALRRLLLLNVGAVSVVDLLDVAGLAVRETACRILLMRAPRRRLHGLGVGGCSTHLSYFVLSGVCVVLAQQQQQPMTSSFG